MYYIVKSTSYHPVTYYVDIRAGWTPDDLHMHTRMNSELCTGTIYYSTTLSNKHRTKVVLFLFYFYKP